MSSKYVFATFMDLIDFYSFVPSNDLAFNLYRDAAQEVPILAMEAGTFSSHILVMCGELPALKLLCSTRGRATVADALRNPLEAEAWLYPDLDRERAEQRVRGYRLA